MNATPRRPENVVPVSAGCRCWIALQRTLILVHQRKTFLGFVATFSSSCRGASQPYYCTLVSRDAFLPAAATAAFNRDSHAKKFTMDRFCKHLKAQLRRQSPHARSGHSGLSAKLNLVRPESFRMFPVDLKTQVRYLKLSR